jgi:thymidine kinase
MPELLAHAEFVDNLQAVCHRCGGPATTSRWVVVGAAEQYEARCRDCHDPGAAASALAA